MMCKKIGIAAAVAGLGLFLLHSTGMNSYTTTAWSKLRGNFKSSVPLEFEIQRVRDQVAQLVPDMKKNFRVVAEETVAVNNLEKRIQQTRDNLAAKKVDMDVMAKDLESDNESIVYNGRPYNRDRVAEKLQQDFNSYKIAKTEMESEEKLLAIRKQALETAQEQLASMRQQKQDLEVQVAQLEAELKAVRLSQTRNKFEVDDSQLSQCKQTLAEIRDRIEVEKKTEELTGKFSADPIAVEPTAKSPKEVLKEYRDYIKEAPRAGSVAVDRR